VILEKGKTAGFDEARPTSCGGVGASLDIIGTVVESPAKGQEIEVHGNNVTVLGKVRRWWWRRRRGSGGSILMAVIFMVVVVVVVVVVIVVVVVVVKVFANKVEPSRQIHFQSIPPSLFPPPPHPSRFMAMIMVRWVGSFTLYPRRLIRWSI